jgi:hypothetical protein
MTNKEFLQEIEDLYAKGLAQIKLKNSDYAHDADPFHNFRWAEYWGVDVAMAIGIRISDKFARLANVYRKLKSGEAIAVASEKIEDTILDAINYLAILYVWLKQR